MQPIVQTVCYITKLPILFVDQWDISIGKTVCPHCKRKHKVFWEQEKLDKALKYPTNIYLAAIKRAKTTSPARLEMMRKVAMAKPRRPLAKRQDFGRKIAILRKLKGTSKTGWNNPKTAAKMREIQRKRMSDPLQNPMLLMTPEQRKEAAHKAHITRSNNLASGKTKHVPDKVRVVILGDNSIINGAFLDIIKKFYSRVFFYIQDDFEDIKRQVLHSSSKERERYFKFYSYDSPFEINSILTGLKSQYRLASIITTVPLNLPESLSAIPVLKIVLD